MLEHLGPVASPSLWRATCLLAGSLAAVGCSEEQLGQDLDVDGDGGIVVDTGVGDTGPGIPAPDTGVDPQRPPGTVGVSGRTLRLDGLTVGQEIAVVGATVRAIGALGPNNQPISPVSSEAPQGAYEINVPQDGQLILGASLVVPPPGIGYLESYEAVTVGGADIVGRDIYVAYRAQVDVMGVAYGVDFDTPFPCHTPNVGQCVYALVVGRVVDDGSAGGGIPTPLAGVGKDEFIFRGEGDPNWYVKGPYFFNGQSGAPTAIEQATTRYPQNGNYRGGFFAYYVEVPQGGGARTFEVSAASPANVNGVGPTRYFGPKTFVAYPGGFTWVELAETGLPVQPPAPPPVQNVDFATDVYPLFLPVAQGGYGCQGCHTDQGQQPAGGLNLYGGPAQAYQGLNPNTYAQRVNVNNPGASYLLRRPLYELNGIQDHPIFAFINEQDEGYRTIYGWIQEGANFDGVVPPPPVDFVNDVRPILYADAIGGGAGCVNCHVTGVNANNAPGGRLLRWRPDRVVPGAHDLAGHGQRQHRRTVPRECGQCCAEPPVDQSAGRQPRAAPGQAVQRGQRSPLPDDLSLDPRGRRVHSLTWSCPSTTSPLSSTPSEMPAASW